MKLNYKLLIMSTVMSLESVLGQYLKRGDHTPEPSSWWDEDMIMIEKEPSLNSDMKKYCHWAQDYEYSCNGWHFFAPHHIFRRSEHTFYLLAQKKTKWMVYCHAVQVFKIIENSTVLTESAKMKDILNHESIKM